MSIHQKVLLFYFGYFKVMPQWEGDKIVMTYTPMGKGKPQKVTRALNGSDFVMVSLLGDYIKFLKYHLYQCILQL